MMGSKVLLKTAPFEPCWFCGCRVPLDAWGPIFAQTEAFATRISVLEALLEGALPSILVFKCAGHAIRTL